MNYNFVRVRVGLDERPIETDFLRSGGGDASRSGRPGIMGGSQAFQGLAREALDEHKQIHFFLDRIADSLVQLEGLTEVEPMRRLAAELQGLKERLQEHHAAEETGGLFQAVLEVLKSSSTC